MSSTSTHKNQPPRVQQALDFLRANNIWHQVSRNSIATSCRDAAIRRVRLGKQGIPLYDELKTLCVVSYQSDKKRDYVLLHTRSNTRFDLTAAAEILSPIRPLARLAESELLEQFDAKYGTVNPFNEPNRFIHLFDESVFQPYTSPHSMMTNLGESTWAVEFVPDDLLHAFKQIGVNAQVVSIASTTVPITQPPVFGILTGNGPESGMALWRQINNQVFAQLDSTGRLHGDFSYPEIKLHSLPDMGLSMQLVEREEKVWQVVKQGIEQLCQQQVSHIALACNTTAYFTDKIHAVCNEYKVEFIPIQQPTIDLVKRNHWQEVSILGIPVVAELGAYSAYRPLANLGVKPIADEKILAAIHDLGYLIKRMSMHGQDVKAMNKLRYILRTGVNKKRVIIALTEISVLLERYPGFSQRLKGLEIIDPLAIYGQALAQVYLDSLPNQDQVSSDDGWGEV